MKRIYFYALLFAALLCTACSCNSTRRAVRQIERIEARHPELLHSAELWIDTALSLRPVDDSALFVLGALTDRAYELTQLTPRGSFTLSFKSDSLFIRYHAKPDTMQLKLKATYNKIDKEVGKVWHGWRTLACCLLVCGTFTAVVAWIRRDVSKWFSKNL